MNDILKYYHTLKHLKPTQIYFQLKYRWRKAIGYKSSLPKNKFVAKSFNWNNTIRPTSLWNGSNEFTFLNLTKVFNNSIDWNDATYGKLWTYNLNYFEYLLQVDVGNKSGLSIMLDYINCYSTHIDGIEPYPTSLRIINWIKYINAHQINNNSVDLTLVKDAYRLMDNLEYHLLANHLLENGFALLFAGEYLQDSMLRAKGSFIVRTQLQEQILIDGAHYELSPMYHQLMLNRVLDSIQLLRSTGNERALLTLLEEKARLMLGWINAVTFNNGTIPLVNDSANGVNATTQQLVDYARQLNIIAISSKLSASGYRKIRTSKFELFLDVGNIQPSYQPGHTHADTFNYLIHSDEKPFIVEAGTSTYENNKRRRYERSTSAHNTVTINGEDNSKVWSSFRVAKRAKVSELIERGNMVSAKHDGYTNGHYRCWKYEEDYIEIIDTLDEPAEKAISYIHLHPEVSILSHDKDNIVTSLGQINCFGHSSFVLSKYGYSDEFNREKVSSVLMIYFEQSLTTKYKF